MARVHRRTPFVRSRRPKSEWIPSTVETDPTTLGAGLFILDQSFTETEPFTVLRTRGMITVVSDQAGATERAFGALGLCVVSDQALAAGAGSLPDPVADKGSDLWFMYQAWSAFFKFGTGVGFNDVSRVFDFDSKAMRKVSPDEAVVMMVGNGSSTDGVDFLLDFRMLIQW